MASSEQLKALLQSHLEKDDDRFMSIALQVAAHEARSGHGKLAQELRDLVTVAKKKSSADKNAPISIAKTHPIKLKPSHTPPKIHIDQTSPFRKLLQLR